MDKNYKHDKTLRTLDIYSRLLEGEKLNKTELALDYNVSERTIQRDISDLRSYLIESNQYFDKQIIYSKEDNAYCLVKEEKISK